MAHVWTEIMHDFGFNDRLIFVKVSKINSVMPLVVRLRCFPVVTIRQGQPLIIQISELYFYYCRTEMMLVISTCN